MGGGGRRRSGPSAARKQPTAEAGPATIALNSLTLRILKTGQRRSDMSCSSQFEKKVFGRVLQAFLKLHSIGAAGSGPAQAPRKRLLEGGLLVELSCLLHPRLILTRAWNLPVLDSLWFQHDGLTSENKRFEPRW